MLDRYSNGEIKNQINHVIWLKVMRPTINSVRLYIADRYGKIISVEDNEVNCTFLFVPSCYKLYFLNCLSCLINCTLFNCNNVARKLRWSLKEFNLS